MTLCSGQDGKFAFIHVKSVYCSNDHFNNYKKISDNYIWCVWDKHITNSIVIRKLCFQNRILPFYNYNWNGSKTQPRSYLIMYYFTCTIIINAKKMLWQKKKVIYSIIVVLVEKESIGSSCSFSSGPVKEGSQILTNIIF